MFTASYFTDLRVLRKDPAPNWMACEPLETFEMLTPNKSFTSLWVLPIKRYLTICQRSQMSFSSGLVRISFKKLSMSDGFFCDKKTFASSAAISSDFFVWEAMEDTIAKF